MTIRIRVKGTDEFDPEVPHDLPYFRPKLVTKPRAGWTPRLPMPANAQEIQRRMDAAKELLSFLDGPIHFMNSEHAVAVANMKKHPLLPVHKNTLRRVA